MRSLIVSRYTTRAMCQFSKHVADYPIRFTTFARGFNDYCNFRHSLSLILRKITCCIDMSKNC